MDGKLKRADIFITTKLFHPPVPGFLAKCKTLDMADTTIDIKSTLDDQFEKCLEELGVGYVDLLLMHWPGPQKGKDKALNRSNRKRCWDVFEALHKQGKAKSIGVSNFTEEHLKELKEDGATIVPHVNQIEMSPYTIYPKIVSYCKENNIVIQAYSPLGSTAGGCLKDKVIVDIADKYKKNPGQIVLRWLAQQGIVVLPRSSSASRIASNMDIFDFELTDVEVSSITALNKNKSFTNENPYDIA